MENNKTKTAQKPSRSVAKKPATKAKPASATPKGSPNNRPTSGNSRSNNRPNNRRRPNRRPGGNRPVEFQDRSYNSKTDTLIYALGGMNEVGKNMYGIEHDDEIILIDCGVLFPEDELLGVDYVINDYSYLVKNQHKIKALVITHGHEDHIGGIPFLLQMVHVPTIYASRFTMALLMKKLEERRLTKASKFVEIDGDSRIKTKHFTVGFFNTIHSIPDSLGILVNTPNGRIVETGDFKFDLTPVKGNSDYQKMAYIGSVGVTLLMSDSTNSGVTGFSISEKKVALSLLDQTKKTPGRLIVSTFASNVIRVSQIIEAALACGRKIAVFGRSMENVVDIATKQGTIKLPKSSMISGNELNTLPANKICIICTGSQGEPLAALSRIASGTHRFIRIIPGDTVIFSSNPIPGNGASVNAIVNKLTRVGANVIVNSPLTSLHTTGHASQEEQKLMIQLIKPKYFMPMHGEYKMLKEHLATALETGIAKDHTFICSNGDVLVMRNETVFMASERIHTDDIYVDGNDISGLATSVIKDRQMLADNGLVAVLVTIDSRYNKILCRPNIVSRGFVFIKESQTLLKEAELLVYDALKKRMQQKTTFGELKNCIKSSLEPFLYQKTNRNPIVIPVILNSKEAMEQLAKANHVNHSKPKHEKAQG